MKILNRVFPFISHAARHSSSFLKLKIFGFPKMRSQLLEIGSGGARNGWHTVDRVKTADTYWDLRFGIPLKDRSCTLVYSSHVLEHFSPKNAQKLLREMYRCLEPGGKVRVCVPDIKWAVDRYNMGDNARDFQTHAPAYISDQPADLLNYYFFMDGQHKFMFDCQSLIYHMENAGFKAVSSVDFDKDIDIPSRAYCSIYIEGVK